MQISTFWTPGSKNIAGARLGVFSLSFCPQNIFVVLKIVAIFREFDFFQNKAKNAGRFRTNVGRKAKCGISRTVAGWLTPMHSCPLEQAPQHQ